MDGEDKGSRERKQRMRARREAEGLSQVSGWVPTARRAYAREVLKAVASGANSLPPDPELAATLDAARLALSDAQAVIVERDGLLRASVERAQQLQAERDAARATEAAMQSETQEAVRAAQEERGRATEAVERAEKAEAAIRQAKAMPGVKGRLIRWLLG